MNRRYAALEKLGFPWKDQMNITVDMKSDARDWADDALEKLGYPGLTVVIEWHPRFTARLGDARYRHSVGIVRLSVPLWPRASQTERKETVMHEICHVVVFCEAKKAGKRVKAHGREWKGKMRSLGLEPTRCHKVNTDGLKRTRKTEILYCPCRTHHVTPLSFKRVVTGSHSYICTECKSKCLVARYPSTPKLNIAADVLTFSGSSEDLPESGPVKPPHSQPPPPPQSKSDSTRLSEWLREASKKGKK